MFSQFFELKRLCQKTNGLFNEKFAIVLGVVVPQTIYVPNHPPPVVSMVSHPPPPQMGIHFWHFLPPWQLFRTFKKHFGFFHRL